MKGVTNLSNARDVIYDGTIKDLKLGDLQPTPEITYTLPTTLHFLWIGDKKMKSKYLSNIQSYQKMNPMYKIHLWLNLNKYTEKELQNITQHGIKLLDPSKDLQPLNYDLIKTPGLNIGAKADLLR